MAKSESAAHCIYCLSTDLPRSSEHVVPLSIGGRFEIPNASCDRCRKITNEEIENPLFGEQFCLVREAHGLRRARKRKKQAPARESSKNSLSIIANFNVPPFQRTFIIPRHEHPPVMWVETYTAPPFLADTLLSQRPSKNLSTLNNKLLTKSLARIRTETGFLSAQYSLPSFTAGQFQRLLCKIACGFFSNFRSSCVDLTAIRRFVLDGADSSMPPHIFSCPASAFIIGTHECQLLSIEADGTCWAYCAVRILPEILDHVYFIRATSIGECCNQPTIMIDYMK